MSSIKNWMDVMDAIAALQLAPPPPIQYVLGFAFTPDDKVALIQKTKPQWQAGFFNGVGGKLKAGETPEQAMSREFLEETGVQIASDMWEYRGLMVGSGWRVFVYTVMSTRVNSVRTMEEEKVELVPMPLIPMTNVISNVPVLLSLCLMPDDATFTLYY